MTATVVLANQKTFASPPGVSLLEAAASAGLALPHSCRSGRCSSCKARCTRGRALPLRPDTVLSVAERAEGWVLTCNDAAAPDAAIELDIEDQAELARIRCLTLPVRVERLERPRPDLLRLTLRLPPGETFDFLPGQYLDLIALAGLRRSYSIANADVSFGIELQIRRVEAGAMSDFLFERLREGDLLHCQGPRGSFHLRDVAARQLLLLATGTGIAPIKAMLEGLEPVRAPARTLLLWGNRTPEDFYWQPPAGIDYHPVCSRAPTWGGAIGHVQDHLPEGDMSAWTVRACGNPDMLDAARAALLARGLPEREFHADAFVASGVNE